MSRKNSRLLILFSFFVSSISLFSQTKQDSIQKIVDQTKFAEIVEVQASFKGGIEGLKKFIINNLKVPEKVKAEKIEGKTYLQLGIFQDGTAVVLKILKSLDGCPECDQAALDLIKIMPKWSPAQMENKIVPCYWNLPIGFSYKNK